MQKDNINSFINSLKNIVPSQKLIKFKTTIYYPGDESELQTVLPLTARYLQATFKKINLKYKEEQP